MTKSSSAVALLGAGYIANWHADALKRVKGAQVSAVCDLSQSAAQTLADTLGVKAYTSLDDLLAHDPCTAIHVLTPPHAHTAPVKQIIEAGRHCFVEKPFCLSSEEGEMLSALAESKGVKLGINHNFMMLPGYEKMRRDIKSGKIGMLDSVQINWRFPLAPLRAGPFGLWMLRQPENLLYEIGVHAFAFVADLFEELEAISVRLRHPITIPGDITHFQGWTITGDAGATQINVDLSLIEGHDDRSVTIRGTGALAKYDFAEDSYVIETAPMQDIVTGPLALQAGQAAQATKTGLVNAARQLTSLNTLAPFGLSLTKSCAAFYQSIHDNTAMDDRLSPDHAITTLKHLEDVLDVARPKLDAAQAKPASTPVAARQPSTSITTPTVLVIGGTGFIGRALCHALADQGHSVRIFTRGRLTGFDRPDGLITGYTGDLKSEEAMLDALTGIETVFHLAKATESTWEGYLANDVGVTRHIGQCCLKAGVKRLVYTGTIASYDASDIESVITEDTPFDQNLDERDLYARSKARCEEALLTLHREDGLPLVIVRPGIVIGKGGPLQHWGIAMWRGANACKMWGNGRNHLPFVLVDDVADGLVSAMTTPDIEGQSFNLIGDPMLSARDYFDEISTAYGVTMNNQAVPTWRFFGVDLGKYYLKRYVAGKKSITRPTLRDWQTREQNARYDNRRAKKVLGWTPEPDRDRFIERGISDIALFGVERAAMVAPKMKVAG
ncbi:MAG: NAD-dependent epimerase/dehydratase family protein [Pseudomonadota bacterium]